MVEFVQTTADVFCTATLNFAAREDELVGDSVEVDILDARSADLPGWHECGFELVAHESATASWDDDDLIDVHHREMEELARSMTGCDVALVSNHIKRGPEHAARHQDLAPISFVHSDFAAGYDELVRRSYVQPTARGTDPGAGAQRRERRRRRRSIPPRDPAVLAQPRPAEDGLSARLL